MSQDPGGGLTGQVTLQRARIQVVGGGLTGQVTLQWAGIQVVNGGLLALGDKAHSAVKFLEATVFFKVQILRR